MMKRVRQFFLMLLPLLALAALAALSACSPRKNTAASRNYQAFITRYNIYYNGDEHYKETLREMEKTYEDDYSQRLFMHPVEAKAKPKSPQPSGNFDRSIEKAQKAIQLRSIKKRPKKKSGRQTAEQKAWLKRSEYNPFLHNAWMMMARSQYYNGDFAGAAATFHYIAKNFTWLPKTVDEARLWQARCYCALDWLFEAEDILRKFKPEELTDKTLLGLYRFARADYLIRSRENAEAIKELTEAIRLAKGSSQKTRLTFLLGQLYALEGRKKEAYDAFKRAGSSSASSYRTKFNARIKQSEVYEGADINPEVKALRRMTRYDRNKDYLDQIYYAIGNLYLSRGDTLNAIENYKLAAEKSTRSGIDKALSQLTLGRLYFERGNYADAQPCYSEAVPQLPEDYPDYKLIKKRSDVLDELAVYSQNVTLQDSLLRLAAMTPEEQMKVIDKIIDDLKKKEKEEAEAAKREEYLAQAEAMGSNLKDNGARPSTFTMNNDDSWYFYNTSARNAGKTEFQRRWGSRKLEDNWRRRNKASFDTADFDADTDNDSIDVDNPDAPDQAAEEETDSAKTAREHAADPHFPEYYLAQIPSTDEEKQTANDVIQEGLYNMGVILKNNLGDFPAAASEFEKLLERYPDNIYRLDAYYNLYLMWMQAGNTAEAEKWRRKILSDFPDSKYGLAMADPNYLKNLREMDARQEELYARAYDDYLENRNDRVHQAYNDMMRDYPLSKLMPKFMFLHALAYVTENKPEEFNQTLREMLERYPQTDATPMASAYLAGMAKGRKINSGLTNTRGMIWDTRLIAAGQNADSTATEGPVEFTRDPEAPHTLLFLFNNRAIQANAFIYDIARHNFTTYAVRDFDIEPMNFDQLGIIAVKGFRNEAEVNAYRQRLAADKNFIMPPGVRPVVISDSNFDLMLKHGASFDEYFKFIGEKELSDLHEAVLPPDEYPSAAEMYQAPAPESSENSDSSETSKAPEAPEAPKAPEAPETPEAPNTPETPETPEIEPDGSEGDDPLLE